MKNLFLLAVGAGLLVAGFQANAQVLLATTNNGELVEIDISAGTATLVGNTDRGWTGLSFDADGNLFAVSRHAIEPADVCPGSPLTTETKCAHLYRIDPNNGAVLEKVGSTQMPYVSDIDFAGDALYGSQWDSRGTLVEIMDPTIGTANPVGYFGSKFDSMGGTAIDLQNGGLSVHPDTGEIWAIENDLGLENNGLPSILKVDATTGMVIPDVIPLGSMGVPLTFGFSGLEILPDGRFIGTRGRGRSELYEINPVMDATSGLAEITRIQLVFDPAITGALNGLEYLKESPNKVDTLINDVIDLGLSPRTTNRLVDVLNRVNRRIANGRLKRARDGIGRFVELLDPPVTSGELAAIDANVLLKDASIILAEIEFQ